MIGRALTICATALLLGAFGQAADASAAPVFEIKAMWGDTELGAPDIGATGPGHEHQGQFVLQVRNLGDSEGGLEDLQIADALPSGVTATGVSWGPEGSLSADCTGVGTQTVTCTLPAAEVPGETVPPGVEAGGQFAPVPFGYLQPVYIEVEVVPGTTGIGTNTATVSGGGAATVADTDQVALGETPASFGIVPGSFETDFFDAAFPTGSPSRIAGDHPFELRSNFDFNLGTAIGSIDGTREMTAHGVVRTVEVDLPRGAVADPQATPRCPPIEFAEQGASAKSTGCPSDTQVGYLNLRVAFGSRNHGSNSFPQPDAILSRVPIYNLVPPRGQAADLGFNAGELVRAHIYGSPDPERGYAIEALTPNISSLVSLRGSEVTIWGVPGDPAHDKFRFYPKVTEGRVAGAPFGAPIRPFLTNPSDCGTDNGGARLRADSYAAPGQFTPTLEGPADQVGGCEDPRFAFEPKIDVAPTDPHAGAPTGLEVHLDLPQRGESVAQASELYAASGAPQGISTPPLKEAVITLPQGTTISPSAAQGLGACSPAQIGLGTDAPVECPEDSRIGTLGLRTPILPPGEQPEGSIYLARQGENPFGNLLSIYLAIEEPERGILVKLPGRVDLDPLSGQVRTTFDDLPQLPVSEVSLGLKGGPRGVLVEPDTCGTKSVRVELFSRQEPRDPRVLESSYEVDAGPGQSCSGDPAGRPFAPGLEAGTSDPRAGRYSPFLLRVTRKDGEQELAGVTATLPEGLTAKLAGVPLCPDGAAASAACPAASQIGTTTTAVGVGPEPLFIPQPGKAPTGVYLAGPYKGAPYSLAIKVPAQAGPFDLGTVAVRVALEVNPFTTRVSAVSDPLPQILDGVPLAYRDIRLDIDREDFVLDPTSCEPMRIESRLVSGSGAIATPGAQFQVRGCAGLGFRPRLKLSLRGGVRRTGHPALKGVLTYPRNGVYADIARARVELPRAEFLDQGNLDKTCTRPVLLERRCPASTVYGHAKVWTPLLEDPLEGDVYLVGGFGYKLPALVADLDGRIRVLLVGKVDSGPGRGLRTTFEAVPDAPVSRFELALKGGRRYGLLENSEGLCAKPRRASASFTAHDEQLDRFKVRLRAGCGRR